MALRKYFLRLTLLSVLCLCVSANSGNLVRETAKYAHIEFSDDHEGFHPAFAACWDTLRSMSNANQEVSKDGYVEFLRVISRGIVNVGEFGQLNLDFISLFYAAACSTRQCKGASGSFDVANSESGAQSVYPLCANVMKQFLTTASFESSVTFMYDPNLVSQHSVDGCLVAAARATVLNGFGCNTNSECSYAVTVQVVSSFFIDCLPPPNNKMLCGSVALQIHVSAHVTMAPVEDDLRHETQDILRDAVADGTIDEFFPPQCF